MSPLADNWHSFGRHTVNSVSDAIEQRPLYTTTTDRVVNIGVRHDPHDYLLLSLLYLTHIHILIFY